jgi:hypothetical protein
VLDFLLSAHFEGAAELREQANAAVVVGLCGCGCPTFNLAVDAAAARPASVAATVPVAATGNSPEAGFVELLLFVSEGWLQSVELVYYEGDPPPDFPSLNSFAAPAAETPT